MNLRDRIRTALHVLRNGSIPANVRRTIADEIAEDDAAVDRAIYERVVEYVNRRVDHTPALVAVQHFPGGKPRPADQPILKLVPAGA